MSEKAFGTKKIEIKGSGIPTISSPTDINLNAVTVAISTDLSVGNNLSVSGVSTFSGDIKATGIVSATTFHGSASGLTNLPAGQLTGSLPAIDGSALTGVVAAGTGVIVEDDGTPIGTAGTINFGTGVSVSPVSAGVVTVTASGGGGGFFAETLVGIHTLSNVGVGTTNPTSALTVKGNTSLENLYVNGYTEFDQLIVSGVSTFGKLQIGISTVYSVSDSLGNIGIGTNAAINEYDVGNSVLSIHGRTWPGNPTVAGSGVLRIYSKSTLLGQIYGNDLTGLGYGKNFVIDSDVPMAISCGTTIYMGKTTEIQQLKVTGVSTFAGITTYTSTIFGKQLTVSGVTTTLTLNVGTGSSIIHTNTYGVGIGTTADVNASFAGGGRDKLLVSGRIRSFGAYDATEGVRNGISVGSDREIIKGLLLYDDGTTPGGAETKGVRITAIDESLRLTANGFTGGAYSTLLINQNGVGIGTTNPQYKLDVRGDINFTGTLYQNGSSFSGGGGGLSGIDVRDEGSSVGVATAINFGTGLSVSTVSAGIATVTAIPTNNFYDGGIVTGNINLTSANKNQLIAVSTGSSITINLPAGSGLSAGDGFTIVDVGSSETSSGNAATFNITVTPNGSDRILGGTGSLIIDENGASVKLVWMGSTYDWRIV